MELWELMERRGELVTGTDLVIHAMNSMVTVQKGHRAAKTP